MATYAELYDLSSNSAFRNKVAVAVVVKAHSMLEEASPSAARVSWAHDGLRQPGVVAQTLLRYVLAANKDATTTQILGATDAAIQTNVDDAADALAGA